MRRTITVLATTVAALSAAGCSSGSAGGAGSTEPATASASPFAGDSADEVLAKVEEAMAEATSVHVKGASSDGNDALKLNLKLKFGAGGGGYGVVTINGEGFALRRVGITAYMKAGAAFWKDSAPGSEKIFAGQWLKGSAKSDFFQPFSSFTSRKLLDEILTPTGKLSRVPGRTIDGVPTIGLQDNDPKQPGILYVSATGKPYPVEIVSTAKKATGSISFTEWDQPVTPKAPAGAIDVDKISAAAAA